MRAIVPVAVAVAVMAGFVLTNSDAQARRSINSRLEEQSGRIGQGLDKKGTNKAQDRRADEASYRIAAQEQAMRTKHNGHLTKHDQRKLRRELNGNSRRIHNANH